jgi:hypothetical protein
MLRRGGGGVWMGLGVWGLMLRARGITVGLERYGLRVESQGLRVKG